MGPMTSDESGGSAASEGPWGGAEPRSGVTFAALRVAVARAERAGQMLERRVAQQRRGDEQVRRAKAEPGEAAATLDRCVGDDERALVEFRAALAEEFLGGLHHEARGSLAVIKGRAQLLRRQAMRRSRPDAQLIDGLGLIDDAVARSVVRLGAAARTDRTGLDAPSG
jgi:signal transduction histidine kinase